MERILLNTFKTPNCGYNRVNLRKDHKKSGFIFALLLLVKFSSMCYWASLMLSRSQMFFVDVFLFLSHSDQLKRHYNLGQYYLEVDLQDLTSFDEQLADKLTKSPAEFLPLVSRYLFQVRFCGWCELVYAIILCPKINSKECFQRPFERQICILARNILLLVNMRVKQILISTHLTYFVNCFTVWRCSSRDGRWGYKATSTGRRGSTRYSDITQVWCKPNECQRA